MKKIIVLLVLIIGIMIGTVLFSSGCAANTLSRDKTKDLIIKHFKFPKVETEELFLDTGDLGFLGKDLVGYVKKIEALTKEKLITYSLEMRIFAANESLFRKKVAELKKDFAFAKEGKITISHLNKSTGTDMAYRAKVSLTKKGEKFVVGDIKKAHWIYSDGKIVDVKLCEKQFLEITGISKEGNKKATVEFTWKYGNITPFCPFSDQNFLSEPKVKHQTVYMQLYNDGWRVVNKK